MFHTCLFFLFMWHLTGVFGVDAYEVKSVSVMEGDSVTLHTDLTDINRAPVIKWWFESREHAIASLLRASKTVQLSSINNQISGHKLQVDKNDGSLNITNIRTDHSGLYEVTVNNTAEALYRFNVTVFGHLPVPVITRVSSPSSSSKCVLLCLVTNVAHVSLSWYNENSLLSSISASDLNIRLSLPLEVEYQDTNTYRCVVSHPFRNQTQHLNITDVCQTCSDCNSCFKTTEAVIRLVVSVLVGVAAVAASVVLIHDIRSRRDYRDSIIK